MSAAWLMPSARAAEEKPSICTFRSVNYTDFFQGPVCFLHAALLSFMITFHSAFQPQMYCGRKVYYIGQGSLLHSLLIQRCNPLTIPLHRLNLEEIDLWVSNTNCHISIIAVTRLKLCFSIITIIYRLISHYISTYISQKTAFSFCSLPI